MKKVLGACLKLLSSAVLFIVLLLASACGSGGSGGFPAGTNNSNPSQVVKYPVYQIDCSTLSSDVTVTTVIAQAKWDTSGTVPKLLSESFTPKNVTIPLNGVVQWVNNDIPGVVAPEGTWNGYNIYSDGWLITDPTTSATTTISAYIGPQPPNNKLCIQFGTPGTYNYHCDVKTGAVGSVTVLNPQ